MTRARPAQPRNAPPRASRPPTTPEPLPEPSAPDATGREYFHRDHFRPSAAWKAFKSSWALTRWIVLVVAVGLGVAAVIAIIATALFTLVDSNI